MKFFVLLLGSLGLLSACARPALEETSTAPATIPLDQDLLQVARAVPGFGGMYFDDNGNLNVYVVQGTTALEPAAAASRQVQLERALRDVYGANLLVPRRVENLDPDKQSMAAVAPPRINIIKGTYDIPQLADWRRKADGVLGIGGVVFTDLDERSNRLKIGVVAGTSRESIQAALRKSGVPLEAVIIEDTAPIYEHATLRSHVRPMPGGVQTEADVGVFANKICTMGFNAIRAGVVGFVTNSHCTTTRGSSNGTDFHQPDDPLFSEGNKVGDEIADPAHLTGGACPVGRSCRFSDSAFIDYTISRGSNIARPVIWNTGTLEINSITPRLNIVAEITSFVDGSELDKVGRTTGWAYGNVRGTCQNTNVADSNITLFCQFRVNRLPNRTYKMTDNGDSGSPVFRWLGTTVNLAGILWGGPDDGSFFVFSPINQIEQELGALTTFNFPSPQPPGGQCGVGRKCCEIEIINNKPVCTLCVPTNAQCP